MVRWQSSETDLPPAPDGPLSVEVDCSTGTRVTGRHAVRLAADWTLTTPHDLDAERVLAALGGSLSCLQLHDVVVPTLRSLVHLSGRHRLAGVSRTGTKRWRWRVTSGSCAGKAKKASGPPLPVTASIVAGSGTSSFTAGMPARLAYQM